MPARLPTARLGGAPGRTAVRRWTWGRALLVVALPLGGESTSGGLEAGPWLQQPTATSVVVMWETVEPTHGLVRFGAAAPLDREATDGRLDTLHEVRLTGLTAGSTLHYTTVSQTPCGTTITTEPATFVTAPAPGAPVSFAVVGDTQDQPSVWQRVAARVNAERPAFLIHCGDIVGDGLEAREWREEFFAPARSLLAHVPFLAVLGNHELDSPLYYRYVANPAPEHRCAWRYGDVEFFLIDSERGLEEGSEQFLWLDAALGASEAPWKFVVVHRPPWSSDLDDYGDAQRTRAAEGDPRTRPVIPLLERRGVDVLFCGHVHDYERTWPLREGRVDEERGVVYVQTGGAGGHGETHAPARSWFTAHVRACHHYLLVNVLGGTLDLKAYDDEGRLFDHWVRRKTLPARVEAPRRDGAPWRVAIRDRHPHPHRQD